VTYTVPLVDPIVRNRNDDHGAPAHAILA
jgi:hypothetical protein